MPAARTLRRLLLAAAAIAVAAVLRCGADGGPSGPPATASPCTLSRVIDADSVRCTDGREIRLLSIDAPEIAQRPWGDEARRAFIELAPPGTRLTVEYDAERTDDFGRDLAYLFLSGGTLLNEELVARGYAVAFVIPPNRRYERRIRAAEERARAGGTGLWSVWGFGCRPADFRARRCR